MIEPSSALRTAYMAFFHAAQPPSIEQLRLYVQTHVFIALTGEVRRYERFTSTVFERARVVTDQLWEASDTTAIPLALLMRHGDSCFDGESAALLCKELALALPGELAAIVTEDRFHRMLRPALSSVSGDTPTAELLFTYGGSELENSTNTIALLSALVALTAALALVLALRARREHKKPSAEFVVVSKFAGETWANKLLRIGRAEHWSLAGSWLRAHLDSAEMEEAINRLDGLMNYRALRPAEGSVVDARIVRVVEEHRKGADWISGVVVPGLYAGSTIVERAAVHAATADEVGLQRLSAHPITNAYLRLHRRSETTDFVMSGTLRDLATMFVDKRPDLDEWFSALAEVAPGKEFAVIGPDVGASYVEREMESVDDVIRPSETIVSAVKGFGLRRRSGEVLIEAIVETRGRTRT